MDGPWKFALKYLINNKSIIVEIGAIEPLNDLACQWSQAEAQYTPWVHRIMRSLIQYHDHRKSSFSSCLRWPSALDIATSVVHQPDKLEPKKNRYVVEW